MFWCSHSEDDTEEPSAIDVHNDEDVELTEESELVQIGSGLSVRAGSFVQMLDRPEQKACTLRFENPDVPNDRYSNKNTAKDIQWHKHFQPERVTFRANFTFTQDNENNVVQNLINRIIELRC